MFSCTPKTIPKQYLEIAAKDLPNVDFRLSLNYPTGDFFYDPWIIKAEFENTIWNNILETLPKEIGEARIIKMDPGSCYRSHADIDDRWHLSIISDKSYIVDLDSDKMYPQQVDGIWHFLDASGHHSAVNFGSRPRYQLVVRKLLQRGNNIINPKTVSITLKEVVEDRRFIFDDLISPWLNISSKKGMVDNFQYKDLEARFTTDSSCIDDLSKLIEKHFHLKIIE